MHASGHIYASVDRSPQIVLVRSGVPTSLPIHAAVKYVELVVSSPNWVLHSSYRINLDIVAQELIIIE